ncbi:MAG: sulfurtransferase TusA family protein [Candidatus Electrothrix aestuarii]|uniref:Sulfurtransferase TusA family protein n=1 Tax=Candidatus Electrothrix aestuarii TaxID=3062594 RepID=A0AAU8LQ06_9BACT|nr:sulfurtransferase TusA family protein [Candidatus Electrothrix aestuarii]
MMHYALPPSLDDDIVRFEQDFAEFRGGRLHKTAFTAKRVKMGVYLERDRSSYMCRIRCSGNIITPKQLAGVASLAKIYGKGQICVTTRAEVQLHRIEEQDVIPVLRKLKEIGLSCKGGGGNTVRNIIANYDSGVSSKEVFDVQPCLQALAERLLRESDSWDLPRKMKIGFCSLTEEDSLGFVQDIGFIAHLNADGKEGFRVYIGGGLGAHPKVGVQLHEFIPQEEVYNVVRAVKNMFHLYGNRRNKHRNRLKFLLHDDLGPSAFRTYYRQELNKVLEMGYPKLDVLPLDNEKNVGRDIPLEPEKEDSDDFRTWKKRHVVNQRQKGLCRIRLSLFLGNLQGDDCIALEKFSRPFGENILRFGTDQNMYLVNIPEKYLANVYKEIVGYSALSDKPMLYGNLVSCSGSQGCQAGLTAPKAVTEATFKYLDTVAAADFCPPNDIMIRISGCPNSCSNHWIADLGFYGKVRRVEGHMIPTYNVLGNGGMFGGILRIAEKIGWVHAYDLPRFITEVMRRYANFKEQSETIVDFHDYWRSGGRDIISELCTSGYNDIPSFAEDKNYYFDHGADELFSLKNLGHEECSAGIYDIINVDDKLVRKNLMQLAVEKHPTDENLETLLQGILFHGARMLLVTRGEEAKTEADVYTLFTRHFLDTGLIAEAHRPLLLSACQGKSDSLCEQKEQVIAFGEDITTLYKNMDDTMRFPGERENMMVQAAKKHDDPLTPPLGQRRRPNKFKDLSGVQCPLNFAQVKVQLFAMSPGEVLEVILDDGTPIENVPESVKSEGHTILCQEKTGEQWSVLIQKS